MFFKIASPSARNDEEQQITNKSTTQHLNKIMRICSI
jgi:hypothetical protein